MLHLARSLVPILMQEGKARPGLRFSDLLVIPRAMARTKELAKNDFSFKITRNKTLPFTVNSQ